MWLREFYSWKMGFAILSVRQLTRTPRPQANAYAMIRRRPLVAEIGTNVGNHTVPGDRQCAAVMPNHASTRTTQLYDRRSDEVTLDEVERIAV